jgi:hypothetical protein
VCNNSWLAVLFRVGLLAVIISSANAIEYPRNNANSTHSGSIQLPLHLLVGELMGFSQLVLPLVVPASIVLLRLTAPDAVPSMPPGRDEAPHL